MHAPKVGFSCSESHKRYTLTIMITSLRIGILQTNVYPKCDTLPVFGIPFKYLFVSYY